MSGSEGAPKPPEPSGVDLARVALRAAKEAARARGEATQQQKQARRGGGLRSGARADGRDPMPLGPAINRLITERGWETPAAVGGVMGRWPQIVGDDLARRCVPERYDEDERVLHVRCDSTAWATNVRLLALSSSPGSTRTSATAPCGCSRSTAPAEPLDATGPCAPREAPVPAIPTGDRSHISGRLRARDRASFEGLRTTVRSGADARMRLRTST